jgi:lactoylglutathione lyase
MAIIGIGHLAIIVSDMKRSTEFYSKILGCKKVFDIEDNNGNPWICYFKVGRNQFIELFYPGKAAPFDPTERIGFSHMCFQVEDIHRTEEEIKKNGGVIEKPIKKGKDGNYQCWINDPDGNRIELMQIVSDSPHAKYMN